MNLLNNVKRHISKTNLKNVFAIVSTVFFFSSCEDPIDVALPDGETMLVVDAFVNDKPETQKVRLTTTAPYFSNVNAPAITGASVVLTDLTANKTFTFNDLGSGDYTFSPVAADSFAMIGHDYRLDINWNGYNYYCVSRMNRTTQVDTIIFEDGSGQGFGDGYFPYIYAFDQAGGKDFYWIKTYKNGNYFNAPSNINVVEDAGGDGTDGLAFIPPNAFFAVTPADDAFDLSNANGQPDICTVEIHSINKACYEFFLQAQKQMTNSSAGLFATTPENIRTNILPSGNAPKAIGWFNIAAVKSKTLPVQ